MSKQSILIVMLLSFFANFFKASAAKVAVTEVHPTNWWAGMKNPELQVLIHGQNIEGLTPVLKDATGIEIASIAKVPNPNYIIIYLNTAKAEPQTFTICLNNGKKTVAKVPYELKKRSGRVIKSYDATDVIYLLMPDRFATGTTDAQKKQMYKGMREDYWSRTEDMARHGGDLAGMRQHLDYLADLGITAIWPTPTLVNDMEKESYHGYAITNFYETDPRIGTNEEYKAFVDDSHAKGIKVIKDLVFNHCGVNNFLYADRPADDWFTFGSNYTRTGYKTGTPGDNHASNLDKSLTVEGWFTEFMPDFNGANKLVADYLIQASKWWVEYAGIDGYRQDTYPYNDFNLMKRWCNELEAEWPGFNIVGETWINNNVGVSYWQKDSRLAAPLNSDLKTVMDFPLMYMLDSCVDEETDEWDWGFARLYALISQDIVYPNPNSLLTFLANHDTNRFQPTKEKAQNVTRYKQALALLLTLRGIPQLYYGDEIGMYANKSVNDGALRECFPGGWPDDKNNAFTAEGRTKLQAEYFDYTRNLLNWRKTNKAVAFGDLTHYTIRNGVYVYSRQYQGQRVTVIANGTSKDTSVESSIFSEVLPKNNAYEVISGKNCKLENTITLSPRQILILDFNK